MPLLNINLLSQQQTRVRRLDRANLVMAIVTGTIVVLQVVVATFLFAAIQLRQAAKNGAEKTQAEFAQKVDEINRFDSSYYPDLTLTDQAKAFQQQVGIVQQLVDNHKYFSLYVSEVAINTPDAIRYAAFAIDGTNRLVISGRGRDYPDISRLADSFGKLSFAKSASIQGASLDTGASFSDSRRIKFSLVIELKSNTELRKLPGPSGDRQAAPFAPSPQPTPSPGATP